MSLKKLTSKFAIVGGGIAGVSCAESLAFLAPEEPVILITDGGLIKAVTNVVPIAATLTQFDVEERNADSLSENCPSIKVICDKVSKVNASDKTLETKNGTIIQYEKLCLCTGARARLIRENNDRVIGIRDTESVENLSRMIADARRIVVVGNGGIATEMVHEMDDLEIFWVIKDKHISATFVDPGAAEFFRDKLSGGGAREGDEGTENRSTRMRYTLIDGRVREGGPALGPDWHKDRGMRGKSSSRKRIVVEEECEVEEVLERRSDLVDEHLQGDWPIYARLTNGKTIGCDFIVSATGVTPNSDLPGLEDLTRADDGGFSVDREMRTSREDIYAAGDVCTANWEIARHWFQMRLWTQAHQMGRYAAKSMYSSDVNEPFHQDFCFELFTHVTKFFGYKVVLLGLYNGQKLNGNYEVLLRTTRNLEYVKLVLVDGKIQGAVLIGDTDLEETCENLILDQLDVGIYGEDLLDPDIDIEDYFD